MEGKWWIWVLVVFTVCLATRIYYVHEKSVIEGDELTSLTLAYNNIGWGDNTYLPGHTYNADELRSNLLADDRGMRPTSRLCGSTTVTRRMHRSTICCCARAC